MDNLANILNKSRTTKCRSIQSFLEKDMQYHKEEVIEMQKRVDFDLNCSPHRLDAKRVRMLKTCPFCNRDY